MITENKSNVGVLQKAPRSETKQFDTLALPKGNARGVNVQRASTADIEDFSGIAERAIGHLAMPVTIQRIASCHPDNIWIIHDSRTRATIGCYAQIMLTAVGYAALVDGSFNGHDPVPSHCATPFDMITGIYTWAVIGRGRAALGVTLMSKILNTPAYRHLDLYTVPVTQDGLRSIQSIGYRPVHQDGLGALYIYRRLAHLADQRRVN